MLVKVKARLKRDYVVIKARIQLAVAVYDIYLSRPSMVRTGAVVGHTTRGISCVAATATTSSSTTHEGKRRGVGATATATAAATIPPM